MLTVRVIRPEGSEEIKEARSVHVIPFEASRVMTKMIYFFEPGSDSAENIEVGDVYVMNDHGKTIAYYHLCYSPIADKKEIKTSVVSELPVIV